MNESQEKALKIEIPMFKPGEFESIDEELNNIDTLTEIVSRLTENVLKEKEQVLSQLIMSKQQKEIERLNNIINEIEKDLDKQLEFCINEANGTINDKYCRIAINYLKHLKSKLQKLKGDSSNE